MSEPKPNEDLPLYPSYECPHPQVAAHAKHIAEVVFFLFNQLPAFNCVPSLLIESALALELFLKSLHSRTVSTRDHNAIDIEVYALTAVPIVFGHDLVKLYDKLPVGVKSNLDSAYSSKVVNSDKHPLRECLGKYKSLFIDMWYVFENAGVEGIGSINSLVSLVEFFHNYVGGMQREVYFSVPDSG